MAKMIMCRTFVCGKWGMYFVQDIYVKICHHPNACLVLFCGLCTPVSPQAVLWGHNLVVPCGRR